MATIYMSEYLMNINFNKSQVYHYDSTVEFSYVMKRNEYFIS
jgi:hypothetical protein